VILVEIIGAYFYYILVNFPIITLTLLKNTNENQFIER